MRRPVSRVLRLVRPVLPPLRSPRVVKLTSIGPLASCARVTTPRPELEFKQVALQFPQLASPYVNLGILYRKTGRLDLSEDSLKTAVERNDGSAVAWTELGATQRLRGEFPNAAASYEESDCRRSQLRARVSEPRGGFRPLSGRS